MKKLMVTLLILTLCAGTAYALTYGADNYRTNRQYALTNSTNDPIRRFMVEVEAEIGGLGDKGTGTLYYVDSGVTSEGAGTSWTTAKNTLQEGIDLCTGNAGDIVYVAQGHAEDITDTSALNADCAGITIIGIGEGEDQPEISFITDAGAELTVSAADVTIYNMRFLGARSGGITAGISITGNGDGARILGCEFRETSSSMEQLIMITAATAADDLVIAGNRFIAEGGDNTVAINLAGASDRTVIAENTFIGTWTDYVVKATTSASTEIMVVGNYINNADTSAGKTMGFNDTTTGIVAGNTCYGNGASFALVGNAIFISPDNVVMQTETTEVRNYESMFGPFTGATGGLQGTTVYADMVLAQTDLDAILTDGDRWDTAAEAKTLLFGTDVNGANTVALAAAQTDITAILLDTGTTLDTAITSIASSIAAMSDTGYVGTNTAASQTAPVVALLAAFGDDYFNTGWSMICTLNYDSVGNAPEGEIRDITDYISLDGTFTVETFSAALGSGDQVMVRRVEDLELDMPTVLGGAGTIRYVDSGTSGDGSGYTWENAYATLVLAEAGSSAGDVIYVADGHNEGWAHTSQPIIDVANLTIIGLGEGDARPLFDFDGTTTLVLTINAAGVTLKNLRFNPSSTGMTKGIHFESGAIGCTMENCSFIDGEQSNDEWEDVILVDQAAAGLTIKNCTFENVNATAGEGDTFINLEDTPVENVTIEGCTIFGDFADAPIFWGAGIPVNLLIKDNVITNTNTDEMCIEGTGAATGMCIGNMLYSNDPAAILDPGSLTCVENYASTAINTAAFLIPPDDDELVEYGTGRIIYCDSGLTTAGDGRSWGTAVKTLDAAINLCSDDRGDTIYVAAGHAEGSLSTTYATADLGGITIIGLGNGDLRPTFTYTGASGTLSINNDDITIKNLHFIAGADSVGIAITAATGSENIRIEDCQFSFASAGHEFDHCIDHAAANHNMIIKNCRFQMGANDAVAIVHFEDSDYAEITDNIVYGDYSTACIHSDTTAADHIVIKRNVLFNGTTGGIAGLNTEPAIELYETTTGVICDNTIVCDEATPEASIIGLDMFLARNTYSEIESNAGSRLIGDDQSIDVDIAALSGKGTGQVWYVDRSGSGEDGRSWASAFTTINLAEAACSADAGDIILVAEGHYEDVSNADAVDLDVAGISVIGMGVGGARPRIDYENAAAEIVISKSNITVKNLQLRPGATQVLKAIDIEGTGLNATIEDCAILNGEETTVDEFVDGIIVHSSATGVTVRNCTYKTLNVTDTHSQTFVNLDQGACVDTIIEGCTVYGDFSEAPIWGAAQVCLNLNIHDNVLTNVNTEECCIEFAGAATGMCTGNKMYADTWGSILDPGSMRCIENYAIDTIDESARLVPATSTVAGQTYAAVCTTSTAFAEDLFAVSAPIFITNFAGIVTGEIAAGPGDLKVWCDATTPAQDADFSTAVACEGDTVGTKYVFTGACPSVLTPLANAGAGSTNVMEDWFCPIGMIEQTNTDGDATGTIVWYITWTCITDGTTVVAQ